MSIDVTLRMKSSLVRHRNVLTRAERVAQLVEAGKLDAKGAVLGLPKVGHRKPKAGAKVKKKDEAAEAAAGGEAKPAAAAGAKPAAKPAAKGK